MRDIALSLVSVLPFCLALVVADLGSGHKWAIIATAFWWRWIGGVLDVRDARSERSDQ